MAKKLPTPKLFDNVERSDYSKVDGYVKEIKSNSTVLVSWFDGYDENGMEKKTRTETVENIEDLALTRRI